MRWAALHAVAAIVPKTFPLQAETSKAPVSWAPPFVLPLYLLHPIPAGSPHPCPCPYLFPAPSFVAPMQASTGPHPAHKLGEGAAPLKLQWGRLYNRSGPNPLTHPSMDIHALIRPGARRGACRRA